MVEKLTAELTASFDDESGDSSIGLHIENDYGTFSVDKIHLLLFPAVGATLRTTKGQVERGNIRAVAVPGGTVSINGRNGSLPKRADAVNPELTVLMAFDKDGNEAFGVTLQYDAESNQLTLSQDCTAVIQFSDYKTNALELLYTPKLTPGPDGSQIAEFGTIAAFYPKNNLTTFDVQPFSFDTGNSTFELYRIISSTVTTQDGAFEKPPNFPTDGIYPGKTFVLDIASGATENEAVHELATMDNLGRVFIQTNFVPIYQPYTGDPTYKPIETIRASSIPDGKYPKDLVLRAKNIVAQRGQGKLNVY